MKVFIGVIDLVNVLRVINIDKIIQFYGSPIDPDELTEIEIASQLDCRVIIKESFNDFQNRLAALQKRPTKPENLREMADENKNLE